MTSHELANQLLKKPETEVSLKTHWYQDSATPDMMPKYKVKSIGRDGKDIGNDYICFRIENSTGFTEVIVTRSGRVQVLSPPLGYPEIQFPTMGWLVKTLEAIQMDAEVHFSEWDKKLEGEQ